MDWPNQSEFDEQLTPLFISTYSLLSCGSSALRGAGITSGAPTSTAWGGANTAAYVPFWLPFPYRVERMFWQNGSAAGDNSDVGIYTIGGARIFAAGTTAGSGNSAPQFVTPATPFILTPGRYFFGYNHSATTANAVFSFATFTAGAGRLAGLYQQAVGATPLPASATFAQWAMTTYPFVGMTRTKTGF